jgi:hypothetical protein
MSDPALLRSRIAMSRHRDFIQAFTDAENRLLARFSSPPPQSATPPQVVYQDRLYDDKRQLDRTLSYALGVIVTERGDATGVALIAFRHDRTNHAVVVKLLKGLAITLFFVALILVQNVLSRRGKLRMMDLEAALSAARAAVRGATKETPRWAAGELGVAFAQADRLGGTVYDLDADDGGSVDLLLAVSEGDGIDAAFAAVVLRDLYRRHSGVDDPAARIAALLADYDASPLGRNVEILFAQLGADGNVRGVVAGLRPPVVIEADATQPPNPLPLGDPIAVESRRLTAPLRSFAHTLRPGDAFALFDDGLSPEAPRRWPTDTALARLADHLRQGEDAESATDVTVAEAVKRYRKKHTEDFFALVARRRAA